MGYSKTEAIAAEIAEPVAKSFGCYLYDVEFVKEGGLYFLRIFADRDGGIDLDTCEMISRKISEELDKKDPIKQNYYLEVASPGIERKLKTEEHFLRYIGECIDIGLYKAQNNSKQIKAVLRGFSDGIISYETDNGDICEIAQSEASYVKLHFDF